MALTPFYDRLLNTVRESDAVTLPVSVANGGTGLTSIPNGSILATSAGNPLAAISFTGIGQRILTNTAGGIAWTLQSASVATAYVTITGNTGTATAATTTDTLAIVGTGAISTDATMGSPDSLTISAANATTSTLGVASFNSTNFTVSTGAVNTIQDIATTSSPTFVDVTHTGVSKLAPGLVGTPSLAFADNLDTGWYEPTTGSSGNIAGTINGTEFIRVDSVQRWGWHGTATSGNNVHTTSYTATGTTTGAFMNFTFTTGASLPAFYVVLNYTAVATANKDIRVASFTGRADVTSYTSTISALFGVASFSATATVTTGTATLIGFNFAPAAGTAGNYTGGILNIVGLNIPAQPSNYTGGATVNYYAVRAVAGIVDLNTGAATSSFFRFGASGDANLLYLDPNLALAGIGTGTPTAALDVKAGTTSAASVRIRSGVAPTSPNSGDIWYDGTHLYGRVNGSSAQLDNAPVNAPVEITGTTQAAAVNTKYYANNAGLVTITLPATAAQGDQVLIRGKGAGGWKLAQNSGQTIHGASDTTTGVGGSLASQARYDCVTVECITANTDFIIINQRGTLTTV